MGVASYVYSTQDPKVGQISLARYSVVGSIALGCVIFVLAGLGYIGAATHSRWFLFLFFTSIQLVFAGLVAVSAALVTGLPWLNKQLEDLCEHHPWDNCKQEIPKMEESIRENLHLICKICLGIAFFVLGVIHATFMTAGEAKRTEYHEIPSYYQHIKKKNTFAVA